MHKFTISKNNFLSQDIQAFYNTTYTTMNVEGNPNYLNDLKNTYGKPESSDTESYQKSEIKKLKKAIGKLERTLEKDLPKISKILKLDSLFVCVVPRSKKESSYKKSQLLFKSTVQSIVNKLDNFNDSTNYIIRNKNTKTTHLSSNTPNYNNDGEMPYKGITEETCTLDEDIKDKDILLIDDIYTGGVNIDEDAIQALIIKGAKSVTFYSVGACGI